MQSLRYAIIVMLGLLGHFVFIEPAPYDYFLIVFCVLSVSFAFNKKYRPIVIMCLVYFAFILAAILNLSLQSGEMSPYIPKYGFTQAYFTFCFAVLVATFSQNNWMRYEIVRWTMWGATISSVMVLLLHFSSAPDLIYRDEFRSRIKGFFEDPNVLGPYLILPITFAIFSPKFNNLKKIGLCAPMLVIAFLSLSRAALIGVALSLLVTASIIMWRERTVTRTMLIATCGLMITLISLGFLPQISGVIATDSFAFQRLQLQDYDNERFEHLKVGVAEGLTHFFGVGPGEFAENHGNNPHNLFIGRLTDAGWIPTIITIFAIVGALLRSLKSSVQLGDRLSMVLFGTMFSHTVISMVIHSHHWRHLLLLIVLCITAPIASDARGRFNHQVRLSNS